MRSPRPVRGAPRGWPLAVALLVALAAPVAAQLPGTQFSLGAGPPAVVTLDQDRLFAESAFGRAVAEAVDRSARVLSDENRRLEQELAAEERALTDRRPDLPAEEFRTLADAFDARVQSIRRTQEARGRALATFRDAQRQRFFEAALPMVTEVVADAGAVVVLDSRAIVLALDEVDITERVRARMDAVLGADAVPEVVPDFVPDGGDAVGGVAPPVPPRHGGPDLPQRPRPRPEGSGGPPLDLPPPVLEE